MINLNNLIGVILAPHYVKLEPMLSNVFRLNMTLWTEYHNIISYQGKLFYLTKSPHNIVRPIHKKVLPVLQDYLSKLTELDKDRIFLVQELTKLYKADRSLVNVRAQFPTFTLTRIQQLPDLPSLGYAEISTLLDVVEFPELAIGTIIDKIHYYTALEMII